MKNPLGRAERTRRLGSEKPTRVPEDRREGGRVRRELALHRGARESSGAPEHVTPWLKKKKEKGEKRKESEEEDCEAQPRLHFYTY